ncbi:MAG: hypothetical protein HETSPECPRED_005143 [Heterodermia speciosa]|uniref:Apple domain-containing protein n=1 Tax=Heterodermia speciosa TaxID=116794 RepID=A0A8H3IC95_9LECA|nr:MAG: hypothetical protein HETSPECPRED_005143 [Heterodermia speciosa]
MSSESPSQIQKTLPLYFTMGLLKYIYVVAAIISALPLALCSTSISIEACVTKYGSTSVKSVGTKTYSVTLHQTASCVATVTPTTTVQPPPKTVTVTSVVYTTKTTTLPNTVASVFTTTQTVSTVVPVTNTITAMTDVTVAASVTVTSTTTIPTSPGFVPAASANALKKRHESRARPNLLAGKRPSLEKRENSVNYPYTVSCGVLVDIIATNSKTVTASKTATVTGPVSTVSKTTYSTSTVVSSYLPAGASTTVTATTTITSTTPVAVTVTSTNTATLTVTVQGPVETFYAACDSNNLLSNDPYDGGNLDYADINGRIETDTVAASAYDCCVQCFTMDGNCGGGFYRTDGSQQCVLASPLNTCDPNSPSVDIAGSNQPVSIITAFDGNCGQVEGT